MAEPILIGTRGWDRPEWTGAFYPEILPADWRLSFYANNLRSVLVPAETWEQGTVSDVRLWATDVYAEFRFVLELSAVHPEGSLPVLPALIEPIRPQVTGLLLRITATAAPDPAWLASQLEQLATVSPMCVDLPVTWRTPAMLACLTQFDAGLCWRADAEAAPRPGGKLMVALSSATEPKAQRQLLECLVAWQGEEGVAGLFFDNPATAQQARLLAELMVV